MLGHKACLVFLVLPSACPKGCSWILNKMNLPPTMMIEKPKGILHQKLADLKLEDRNPRAGHHRKHKKAVALVVFMELDRIVYVWFRTCRT